MLCALFAVLLPTPWMAATHRWLGLGEFPASPLVDYLTRSIACLYALHGALFLALARDVTRHRPIIVLLAKLNLLFGAALIGIDLHAGLPIYWTLAEGPPILGFALVMLWLARSPEAGRMGP